MGRLFLVSLEGKIYSCKHCQTHLALSDDILSKAFHCKHGKAYLFDKVQNCLGLCLVVAFNLIYATPAVMGRMICDHSALYLGSEEVSSQSKKCVNISVGFEDDRMMTTGLHTVSDVFCVGCGSIVGWKYEVAHEKTQKYKEGKIVLERFKLTGPDGSRYWITQDAHMGGSDPDDV
ncbi:hypothetical protein ZIOFF_000585 [Zingiber officinale]|uniref:Yippee domain-containing protein n=1 Tax=Zingiber officinale TaxID=94328 RepID=A0A8J5LUJ0_ZINOF|nr:hypothetical protein ZIOFF_000585 [Zingiber officinale]